MNVISNYWMRQSRIWRIPQIKEGVIHTARRPNWITQSEICRILHTLRKPNSILVCYSFKIFPHSYRSFAISLFVFLLTKNNTISSPGFLGQRFNNLQWAALLMSFWCHWFNNLQQAAPLTSLIQYDKGSFQKWSTAAYNGQLCVWI